MRFDFTRLLCAIAVTLLIGGCGNLPQNYTGADGGYLVLSLGESSGTSYWWSVLRYRPKGGTQGGEVVFSTQNRLNPTPVDYETADGVGSVAVHRLPPGDYELYNLEFRQILANGQRTWTARDDFSAAFRIEPGVVTYLGSFMAAGRSRRGALGEIGVDAGYFKVADRRDRDLGLARRKHAVLAMTTELRSALPAPRDVPAAFFQFVKP